MLGKIAALTLVLSAIVVSPLEAEALEGAAVGSEALPISTVPPL